jgi:hypothetical protein
MKDSCDSPDRRCSDSAPTHAGARWSAFGSGSDAGDGGAAVLAGSPESGRVSSGDESESSLEMIRTY